MFDKIRIYQVAMLAGLFLVILLSQFVLLFIQDRGERLKALDKKLLVAAGVANTYLDAERLHAYLAPASLSKEEEVVLSFKLGELAAVLEVAFVYTIIQRDKDILFVVSSPTEAELNGKPFKHQFWTTYPEADVSLLNSMQHFSIEYGEYTDRWGTFRSIFVPKKANDGSVYAIGVDVSKHKLSELTFNSLISALKRTILFFSFCLPFVIIASRTSNRFWKAREQALFVDDLTGLKNKSALLKDIKNCTFPSLSIINIDRFREVSNVYGLADGDAVLRAYAYNLASYQHAKLKSHSAYRIHSDEFAVLADIELDFEARQEIFKDFYKALVRQHYRMSDGKNITFSVKAGIAFGDVDDLYARAEMALRKARETNTSVVMFDLTYDLIKQYENSIAVSATIKSAISEDRVVPFFHPIVSTKTGDIEKYEVLARIIDNDGNVIMMPDQFIPVLKRDRLYTRFTLSIAKQSLRVARRENVDISLNISTQDIADKDSFDELLSLISHSGIASTVHIELLECDSLVDLSCLIVAIKQLKKIGCRVGLDDLGKGYSNFDRLTALPIDFVKLDRSVMQNIVHDLEVMRIAEDIIRFARDKDISTVAEFCSNEYLCKAAKHMGIDFIQGFYIAEPSQKIVREVNRF